MIRYIVIVDNILYSTQFLNIICYLILILLPTKVLIAYIIYFIIDILFVYYYIICSLY